MWCHNFHRDNNIHPLEKNLVRLSFKWKSYLETNQEVNFTIIILSRALSHWVYPCIPKISAPTRLAPLWCCGIAVADSEPEESLFGRIGLLDSSRAVSTGTFGMSPGHHSPVSGRRRSPTDGCWYAWLDGVFVQELALPPFVPYTSPERGREKQWNLSCGFINKSTFASVCCN